VIAAVSSGGAVLILVPTGVVLAIVGVIGYEIRRRRSR
jgi:hypothetical protein